jgi:hypothetical protein
VDEGGEEQVQGVGDAGDDVDELEDAADREVPTSLDAVGKELEEGYVDRVPDLPRAVMSGCVEGVMGGWMTFCRRGACALGSWASWCITAKELRRMEASSEAKSPPCRESHS